MVTQVYSDGTQKGTADNLSVVGDQNSDPAGSEQRSGHTMHEDGISFRKCDYKIYNTADGSLLQSVVVQQNLSQTVRIRATVRSGPYYTSAQFPTRDF